MTLSTTTNRVSYAGDGSTAGFAVPFLFLVNGDIEAVHRDAAGIETTWTENTHYTLTGAGNDAGGTLTVKISPTDYTPAVGETLVVRRVVSETQETDYPEGGAFPASAHETALDKLTMLVQQHSEEISRAMLAPVSDSSIGALPLKSALANMVLGFDVNGDPIAATGIASAVSAFIATLVDDPDAATARTTLGFTGTGGTVAIAELADEVFEANRNVLINGDFAVWQRGTGFASATAIYTADRWKWDDLGSNATKVVGRQASDLANFRYFARVGRDNAATWTTAMRLYQALETVNSIPLEGKTVTLSFYARKGALYSATSDYLLSRVFRGTGTDESAASMVGGTWTGSAFNDQNNALTTSWQRFEHTYTVPAGTTQVGVEFRHTPVGTADATDHFDIVGVQLEVGSAATPFKYTSIADTLAKCDGYFQAYDYNGTHAFYDDMATGIATGGTTADFILRWRTPLRAAPAVDLGTATDWQINAVAATTVAVVGTAQSGSAQIRITNSGAAYTTGQGYNIAAQTVNRILHADAEL